MVWCRSRVRSGPPCRSLTALCLRGFLSPAGKFDRSHRRAEDVLGCRAHRSKRACARPLESHPSHGNPIRDTPEKGISTLWHRGPGERWAMCALVPPPDIPGVSRGSTMSPQFTAHSSAKEMPSSASTRVISGWSVLILLAFSSHCRPSVRSPLFSLALAR